MNIEKLVRHLKEFTLDEIEMIAECDCKTALEQLLNEDNINTKNRNKSRLLNLLQNLKYTKTRKFYLKI